MTIDLPNFFLFIGQHLSWFADWVDDRASLLGAVTFGGVGVLAAVIYAKRKTWAPFGRFIVRHPLWMALPGFALASFLILLSNKYLTAMSATATAIGVLVALDNNRRSHDREEQRFRRQSKAARAALNLDLSNLNDHCIKLIEEIDKIPPLPTETETESFSSGIKFPPTPASVTSTIKEVMLSTKNEAVSDRCALILGHLQLIHAYLDTMSWDDMLMSQSDVETRKLRVAILYTMVDSLFDYARHGIETLPDIDWKLVATSASHLGLDTSEDFNDYMEKAKKNHSKGPLSVWEF